MCVLGHESQQCSFNSAEDALSPSLLCWDVRLVTGFVRLTVFRAKQLAQVWITIITANKKGND